MTKKNRQSGHECGAETREHRDAPVQQRIAARLRRYLTRHAHLLGHPALSDFLP
jgi:hypothetical protein